MFSTRIPLLPALFAVLAGTGPLGAQDLSFRVAAGIAVPAGGAGERRDTGPSAMMSVEIPLGRLSGLRLDGEWSRLTGKPAPAGQEHFSDYQHLRSIGVSLNAIGRFSEGRFAPYMVAGLGAYRLQRLDAPASPYGTTGALQAGLGVDGPLWQRVAPFLETRAMLHVTDYGSDEFSPTVYLPILVGLRVR